MIDSETIKKARQADLAEYLLSVGVPLTRSGNRYRHAEHDSLVFTGGSYYWNSRGGESGNAIDYLTKHMNMNFKDAVNALTSEVVERDGEQPSATVADFKESDIIANRDNFKVRRYLNKERHIGYSVIDYFTDNKLLLQERHKNNAIFPMYDENNIMIGVEKKGIIVNDPFQGIQKGSKYGYGFNVRFSNDNTFDYALFFECPVDLMSFIDYKFNYEKKTLDRCILISMCGLKPNVLKHMIKVFQGDLKVVLCVDNDTAGQEFINKVAGENIPFSVNLPDSQFKDWNEQLTKWRSSKSVVSRIIERNSLLNRNSRDTQSR